MKRESFFRIPIILSTLFIVLLMGCGSGLGGSAIGQNATQTETLEQELTSMAADLASLNAYYRNLESEVEQTKTLNQNLIDLSEDLIAQDGNYSVETSAALDESRYTLWRFEDSLMEITEERERIIGELLGLITTDITNVLLRFSDDETEIEETPPEIFDALFDGLIQQEIQLSNVIHDLNNIETTLKTIDLTPVQGFNASSSERGLTGSKPPPEFLYVSSDEQYQEWISGEYYPCTSTPCGHLNVTSWNNKEIYVKVSGQSTDPSDDWYWAYIFKYSPGTWVIQYVSPALTDASGNYMWNAHRYSDAVEPWTGVWDDITITPIGR